MPVRLPRIDEAVGDRVAFSVEDFAFNPEIVAFPLRRDAFPVFN